MLHLSPARRNRLILVAALAAMVLLFLWVARSALVPYIFALALAYILLPAVNRLEILFKRVFRGRSARFARPAAILLTYVLVVGALVLFFSLVVPVIAQQFQVLWDSRDQLVDQGRVVAANIVIWYERAIPLVVQERLLELAQQAGGTVASGLQAGILGTLSFVTNTFGFVLGLIVIPFWLFYILYDQAKAMRGAFGLVPSRLRADALNLLRIVDDILSAYLRGQLLLCVFIGVVVTVGLIAARCPFPRGVGPDRRCLGDHPLHRADHGRGAGGHRGDHPGAAAGAVDAPAVYRDSAAREHLPRAAHLGQGGATAPGCDHGGAGAGQPGRRLLGSAARRAGDGHRARRVQIPLPALPG